MGDPDHTALALQAVLVDARTLAAKIGDITTLANMSQRQRQTASDAGTAMVAVLYWLNAATRG